MYEALDALTAGQPVEQTLKTLRTLAEVFPVAEALHRRNGALHGEGAGIVSASIAASDRNDTVVCEEPLKR